MPSRWKGWSIIPLRRCPSPGATPSFRSRVTPGRAAARSTSPTKTATKLWKALWEAGAEFGLKNIGLGARDTLRLEKGFCLYGNDIDDTTSPLEAGLGWITKFAEGKDFIDRAAMERLKAEGVGRKLVGLKMVERGIPRHGYAIAAPDGTEIGHVTSGTMSPCLKVGVALGYVEAAYAKPGTEIAVVIREKPVKAEVVKIPFV